ncbi:hypothetical protein RI367_008102 [Sorochytrium milnesiophthora]
MATLANLPQDILRDIFELAFARTLPDLTGSAGGARVPTQPSRPSATSIHAFAGTLLCRSIREAVLPLLWHTVDIRGPRAEVLWKRFVRTLSMSAPGAARRRPSPATSGNSNGRYVRYLAVRDVSERLVVTGLGRIIWLLTGVRACTLLSPGQRGRMSALSLGESAVASMLAHDLGGPASGSVEVVHHRNRLADVSGDALHGGFWEEFGDEVRRHCANMSAIMVNFGSAADLTSIIKNVPCLTSLVLDVCDVGVPAFEQLLGRAGVTLRELCISFPAPALETHEAASLLHVIAQFTQLEALQIELPTVSVSMLTACDATSTKNMQAAYEHAWESLCAALPRLSRLIVNAAVPIQALFALPQSSTRLALLSLNIDKITSAPGTPPPALWRDLRQLWSQLHNLRVLAFALDRGRLAPEIFMSTILGGGLPASTRILAVSHLFAVAEQAYSVMHHDLRRLYPDRPLTFLRRRKFHVAEQSRFLVY